MRRTLGNIARKMWYDRNPSITQMSYNEEAVAPHVDTQRASVTIGANKKAMVHGGFGAVYRVTAAAPALRAFAYFTTDNTLTLLITKVMTNTVGDKDNQTVGDAGMLSAGQIIRLRTGDTSTGGTVDYSVAARITEFDA